MALLTVFMEGLQSHWVAILIFCFLLFLLPSTQFLLGFIQWIRKYRAVAKVVHQLPGPTPHWLTGNLHDNPGPNEKGFKYFAGLIKIHPKYFGYFFSALRPEVFVCHPDTIKLVLNSSSPKPLSFGGPYTLLKSWLGNGLLLSSGPTWHRNRKLLTPGFHFDVLKPYIAVKNRAAETLIKKWDKECAQGSSVEIYNSVSLCTIDVILKCAFSFQEDVQLEANEYVNSVRKMSDLLVIRAFKLWFYFDKLYYLSPSGKHYKKLTDFVHHTAEDIIQRRSKVLKKNAQENERNDGSKRKYVDFLDILLLARDENGQGLSKEEIRQEVDTFLFEGHDTTASAISWILYSLAKHPDIQQQCRNEVSTVITDPDKLHLDWESLQKLPFLTQCIKEGLRFHSPVPFISRELSSPLQLDGHTLPTGTLMNIWIPGLHHNTTVWGDDHDKFKPERFTQENMVKMDSHAFIPFSAGPRNCIGQNFAMHEMKIVVGRVLQHFELSVDESHHVEKVSDVIMRPKDGIKLSLKPINKF